MQGQNKPTTRHCQDIFEGGEKMFQIVIDIVRIVIDIALIVISTAAIVIVAKGWKK